MKTVQMTLDEDLNEAVEQTVAKLGSTRSAFTRQALRQALSLVEQEEKEQQHREGYARQPAQQREFDDWQDEQVWPT